MNTMNTSASTTGSSPRLGPDVIVLDGGMGDELRRKFPVGCHREMCYLHASYVFGTTFFEPDVVELHAVRVAKSR